MERFLAPVPGPREGLDLHDLKEGDLEDVVPAHGFSADGTEGFPCIIDEHLLDAGFAVDVAAGSEDGNRGQLEAESAGFELFGEDESLQRVDELLVMEVIAPLAKSLYPLVELLELPLLLFQRNQRSHVE